MALIIKDRVKEITTTTGTGAVSLGGASATFDAFQSVMSNGDTTFYAIVHTASGTDEWEVGLGTWNTGNTLTRTTVYAGSNGTSAVNFSSGNKDIFMTYPASKAAVAGEDVTFADVTATDITATGTVTLSGDPTSALQAATKEYVDTIAAAGIHYHTPVRVEAPSALTATYDNGTSGVGATLTNSGTQAALVIDGVTLSTSDRVLVYNQTNAAHNGVYTVTNTGSASTNWVLTRATDADSYGASDPDAMGEGDAYFVKEGDTGAGELYVMNTSGVITFGTTNITFTVIAETAVYSAGTGLTLTGTTFSTNQDISTSASPTFAGGTFTGNVDLGDDDYIRLGASQDLQIYHNASHSVIKDAGTGNLNLLADNLRMANAGWSKWYFTADSGGAATVFWNGAARLATSSAGVDVTGNITVSGTVDGRDVATDGTKLDGIETGATGDQTASEILTAIKTVDGAASGLDADLLDGLQGSSYLNTSTTFSGDVSGTYNNIVVANDSHTHDGRYYTETEADSRFVNVTGDTMSGDLTLSTGQVRVGTGGRTRFQAAGIYDDSTNGNAVGIFFGGGQYIGPLNGSGNAVDNVVDIGSSSYRFNDLHLGGTATFSDTSTNVKLSMTGNAGASSYNYFLNASNDGGTRAVHFVNGTTRTADGGANTYTIRNDAGTLRLGKSGYTTQIEGNAVVSNDLTVSGSLTTEGPDGGAFVGAWPYSSGYAMFGTANMTGQEYALITDGTYTYLSGGSGGSVTIRGGVNDSDPQIEVTNSDIKIRRVTTTGPDNLYLRFIDTSTEHGVIGTGYNDDLFIASTGKSGIRFTSSGIAFGNDTGTVVDNTYDLGLSTYQIRRGYFGTDVRAPIFYDTNNTAYYVDPSASSTSLNLNGNGKFKSNSSDSRVLYLQQHATNAGNIIQFTDQNGSNMWELVGRNNWFYIYNNQNNKYGALAINPSNNNMWINPGSSYTTDAGYNLRVTGNFLASSDIRSPIFYDSNDTAYYVNPNGTSRLNAIDFGDSSPTLQQDGNYLRITGTYGYVSLGQGNASYSHFYTDRSQYYFNVGLMVDGYGIRMYDTSADVRSYIFYDQGNTAYYVNPDGTSSMWNVNIRGDLSSTATGNQIFFWGNSSTTTSAIGFKSNGGNFSNPTGSGDGYNTYLTMDTAGRGWVFRQGTGSTNFAAVYTSGWILNNGLWQANGSMRAPVFYDSGNTSYYVDPASTSNLNALNVGGYAVLTTNSSIDADTVDGVHGTSFIRNDANQTASGVITLSTYSRDALNFSGNTLEDNRGIAFNGRIGLSADYNDGYLRLNNASEFGNGVYTPGILRSDHSMRAPWFYDQDNTAFYVNPAGTSLLSAIYLNDWIMHNGDVLTKHGFNQNGRWQLDLSGSTAILSYRSGSQTTTNLTGNIHFNGGGGVYGAFGYHVGSPGTGTQFIDNQLQLKNIASLDSTTTSTIQAVAGGGATGGGSDEVFYENGQTVTTNYTITNGKNAMSAGPITVNNGVTVTVGDGETWTVV